MSIQIGAFFPTNDLPADRVEIRDWAQAAEAIGFDFTGRGAGAKRIWSRGLGAQ